MHEQWSIYDIFYGVPNKDFLNSLLNYLSKN